MHRKPLLLLVVLLTIGCSSRRRAPGTTPTALTIDAPADGSIVLDRQVDVTGRFTGVVAATTTVSVNGIAGAIDSRGAFVVTAVPLVDGDTPLIALVSADGTPVATGAVTARHTISAVAAEFILAAAGGTVQVANVAHPLFGAAIEIAPGSAQRDMRVRIEEDEEHERDVPFGYTAVGPSVFVGPLGEVFAAPTRITVPFDPTRLPNHATVDDAVVLALTDGAWRRLQPTQRLPAAMAVEVDDFTASQFVVAVEQPLAVGQLRVTSTPAGATIYVDVGDTGLRTPAVIDGVPAGEREVKLYIPGFDEVFLPVTMPTDRGAGIDVELQPVVATPPLVSFDAPLQNGYASMTSLLAVRGRVVEGGQPLGDGRVVVSLNGLDSIDRSRPNGTFEAFVSLLPGRNLLQVRTNGATGHTGATDQIEVLFLTPTAGTDNRITATLTWDTNATDVDMHVFDPSDNHAWYGNLGGIPGAMLDRDDVDGFGPEVFTAPQPAAGEWHVCIDYYSDHGNGPTTATLTIFVGTRAEFRGTYRFTRADFNATRGRAAGADPRAFWDAHQFEIAAFRIASVASQEGGTDAPGRFTTLNGESRLTVTVEAPSEIPDGAIRFEIVETVEPFTIDTNGLTGRMIDVLAAHAPLTGLTNPPRSHPLTYRVVAYTLDGSGARDRETAPLVVTQDRRSQIRQEYVDKRDFRPAFVRETPAYGEIIDATGYTNPGDFRFEELSAYSDFGPGLAVVADSANIAQTVRDAWGFPIRVTSGWRNPRRNDSLANSDINSFHQTGSAVDLNPSTNAANWPAGVRTYEQAQQQLTATARRVLDDATYDILFHANHLHIERDPH